MYPEHPVTLQEVLDNREARAAEQMELLRELYQANGRPKGHVFSVK